MSYRAVRKCFVIFVKCGGQKLRFCPKWDFGHIFFVITRLRFHYTLSSKSLAWRMQQSRRRRVWPLAVNCTRRDG